MNFLAPLKCVHCGTNPQHRRLKYCKEHHCGADIDRNGSRVMCPTFKNSSDKFCPKHQCQAINCKEKKNKTDVFCKWHECEQPTCKEEKAMDGIYCSSHECELKQCHEVRKDSNTEFHYCTKHNCEKDGCKLLKGVDKATQKQSSFCDQHAMKVCTVPDCGEKKLATTPGDYCKNHTCQDANCLRLRKYRSGTTYEKFCYRHYVAPRLKCTKTPCNNYRLFDSEFCEQHTCFDRGCKNEADFYCKDHTCKRSSCKAPREYYLDHDHTWRSDYCLNHECKEESCHEKYKMPMGYCQDHGCVEPGCMDKRSSDRHLGGLCLDCYNDKNRAEWREEARAAQAQAQAQAQAEAEAEAETQAQAQAQAQARARARAQAQAWQQQQQQQPQGGRPRPYMRQF